jgi:hypothetical protein
MSHPTFETGESPRILIASVGGDLRVTPLEGTAVQVLEPAETSSQIHELEGGLELESRGDCVLRVPPRARLEVGMIGGDAIIHGVRGDLLLRSIGGDLRLEGVGQTAAELVGGDLSASQVEGSLMIDRVGGDARVERVGAELHLRSVGGDLRLREVQGATQATAGGDALLNLLPPVGSRSAVRAGGDLRCALPAQASVRVQLFAGGDVRVAVRTECEEAGGGCLVRLGAEEAELELRAGGDISLRSGEEGWVRPEMDFGEAVAASVGAELGQQMAGLEFKLNGLSEHLPFDAGKLTRRLRQAVERAQRKAERARRRAEAVKGLVPEAGLQDEPASEEERMIVLRMLEQGRISVDQADSLLGALEE